MELFKVLDKRGTDYILNEKAFVLRIARHKIYRHYSLAQKLSRFVPSVTEEEDGAEAELMELEPDTHNMEDGVISKLLCDDVQRLIKGKPDEIRRIFHLFYSLELTIPEIAELLGTNESNVKNKLYRTLKELRSLYRESACD